MGKSKELKTTTELVKRILRKHPEARSSDNVLYYLVLSEIGRAKGIDVDNMSVPRLFLNLKSYSFPQFESVRRTRQKIQAAFPELAGSDTVEAQRALHEEDFKEYARSILT